MISGTHNGYDELLAFAGMGTRIRLAIGPRTDIDSPRARDAALQLARRLRAFERRLSRFIEASELSRLNANPRPLVAISPLMARLLGSGLEAAKRTGGLVDPTQLDAVERAGYDVSRVGATPADLAVALAAAPARRPAGPDPRERWRSFEVGRGTVRRPAGVEFDSGGIGKGLAADIAAERLGSYERFIVDCGGDIRVGGRAAMLRPFEIAVRHPLSGDVAHVLRVSEGAVATSGLDNRIWRDEGGFRHHVIDPATGGPAWTGLVSATAIARTGIEAEALAKAALLAGPTGCERFLAARGGVVVADDGSVRLIGQVDRAIGTAIRFDDRSPEVPQGVAA